MCDVQLRAWKECDFGHHVVFGVRFQKPGTFSCGLGWPPPPLGHHSGVYMDSLWLLDIWNISVRRTARDGWSKSCLSSLCVKNWGPCTSFPNSLIFLYLVSIWVGTKVKRLLYNVCLTNSREDKQVITVWSSHPKNFENSVKYIGCPLSLDGLLRDR
jgi:hypothetical protein